MTIQSDATGYWRTLAAIMVGLTLSLGLDADISRHQD